MHYLTNITEYDELVSHSVAGASWEGYVIEQITGRLSGNVQAYYYRTQNGAEIDLCLVRGNESVALRSNYPIIHPQVREIPKQFRIWEQTIILSLRRLPKTICPILGGRYAV